METVDDFLDHWEGSDWLPLDPLGRVRGDLNFGRKASVNGQAESQLGNDSWPDPLPFDDHEVQRLRSDILPGTLGQYSMALAAHTETPLELSVSGSLSVISTSVSKKAVVEASPGYREPVNTFMCTALESGNRKSAIVGAEVRPIAEWEQWVLDKLKPEIAKKTSERKSQQAVIEQMRRKLKEKDNTEDIQKIVEMEAKLPTVPSAPTLFTSDCTAEKLESLLAENGERVAILSDEGGIFDVLAGRYGKEPNVDIFLKGFDARVPHRVHRLNREAILQRPTITMFLSPQPSVLQDLRNKRFMRGRGLLARFLYMLPMSPIGSRTNKPVNMPSNVENDYRDLIFALLEWQPKEEIVLSLSPDAYAEWKSFQGAIEKKMADGNDLCRLRDWGSKLPGTALRIAGLLHLAVQVGRHDDRQMNMPSSFSVVIEKATMDIALELAAVAVSHAIAVFGLIAEDESLQNARRILRWLLKRDFSPGKPAEVIKRDLFRAHQHVFGQVKELDACLRILIEHHMIRIRQQITNGGTSEILCVNPGCLVKEGVG